MNDYFNIGKIAGTHGIVGEVVLQHALGKKSDLKGLATIFIEERKNSFLPYFIEKATVKNDQETFLKLEGFHSRESAKRIVQKEVWLLKNDFEKFASKSSAISLLGYSMYNQGKMIGEVVEVIEQPMQVLCKIIYKSNEALIPIHEGTLQKIDNKRKEVFVTLPDGLLELYSS